MLYNLFEYLNQFDIPGAGLFQYITFRASSAVIFSLIISMLFGKRIIDFLRKKQVGESIRDLGLEGQTEKQGTPTMGGLIILAGIIIPTLFFARLDNIYIQLMLVSTVLLGLIGFVDDYIKVFKKNKKGLAGKFKILGQIIIGLFVGISLYFHEDVLVKQKVLQFQTEEKAPGVSISSTSNDVTTTWRESKSMKTTIPFFKNNEFDYAWMIKWIGDDYRNWAWLVYIPLVILVVTAVSNGANMTDGLDGLAGGTSAIIGMVLAIFAYVSSNIIFSDYLNIMFIPQSEELVIFMGAFVGACVGFLWYNSFPAQVFMGDTGSLAIGGIIAVFALAIRKELLIPLICGIFLIENLSVIIQVVYFKYTKNRYGEGKRIFLMSPLHHHYQKKGYHESKIVSRFWILGMMLAILSIATLKLR